MKKEIIHKLNFLTFDIETYLDEKSNSIPYAYGFYDGKTSFVYYKTDFNNFDEMLLKCINDMMKPIYKGSVVYGHNFTKFDSTFLLKLLYNNFKVKNISKDNDLIYIKIKPLSGSKPKTSLIFRDSKKLLISSLKDLG